MAMKFNMIHLTMCIRIINSLDCTFIVIVKNIWGFNKKLKLAQELAIPNNSM